jgi:hypothetical protein
MCCPYTNKNKFNHDSDKYYLGYFHLLQDRNINRLCGSTPDGGIEISLCTTVNNYEQVRKCVYSIISSAFTPFCLIIWKTIRLHEKMYMP